MSILAVAVIAALLLGVALGLRWHGVVVLANRRALDEFVARLSAEHRIDAQTRLTLQAMRHVAKQAPK